MSSPVESLFDFTLQFVVTFLRRRRWSSSAKKRFTV